MSAQNPDQISKILSTTSQQQPELDTSAMKPSHPSSTSPPHTSQPQDRRALAEQLGDLLLDPLCSSKDPYVSFNDLVSKYRVSSIGGLDLYTGNAVCTPALKTNSQFLLPETPEQILAWLNKTKARTVYDDLRQAQKISGLRPKEKAVELWRLIDTHLTRSSEDAEPFGFLENCTNWKQIRLRGGPYVQRWDEGYQDWQVQVVRRFHVKPPGAIALDLPPHNPETPHVNIAMIEVAPLQEKHLSTGEMTVLVYHSLWASSFTIYQKHVLFPVTLLIISDRQLRITQCIYDVRNGKFEIRKTPIVNFENGVWREKQKEYLAVLGWMSGKPKGTTK